MSSQHPSRVPSKATSREASQVSLSSQLPESSSAEKPLSTQTSKANLESRRASKAISRAASSVNLPGTATGTQSTSARNSTTKLSVTSSLRASKVASAATVSSVVVDIAQQATESQKEENATEPVASVSTPETEATESAIEPQPAATISNEINDQLPLGTSESAAAIEALSPEQPPETLEEPDIHTAQVQFTTDDEEISINDLYSDSINITSLTSRLLESPLPTDEEGFTFINIDYEADPDLPIITMGTKISRSSSWDWGIEQIPSGVDADMILVARPITPIIRPSTPVTEEKTEQTNQNTEQPIESESTNLILTLLPDQTDFVDRESIIAEIRAAVDSKEKHISKNLHYQNLLGEYFRRKRTDEARDGEKSVTDQEKRYLGCMKGLSDLANQYLLINSINEKNVTELNVKLQEKIDEASTRTLEFTKFKRTAALAAENSRTGKPIPIKVIDQLEATEQRKEAEVVAVRLENIKLRNKLKRDELLLRQKEELADGLHLIDFEQLKIENQTYNEKIEERNEDLLKLRKKITNVVQELTHVKEKLQFVQAENIDLKQELSSLDHRVSTERDQLPTAKHQRDTLRLSNTSLKHRNGLLGNVPLLNDFEQKVDMLKEKVSKIDNLRDYHQMLAAESLAIKRKIRKAQLLQ